MPRALLLGCAGPALSDAERAFFRDVDPYGFILFARNIEDRAQTRALVDDLRSCARHPHAPVLIDQEGGRVRRMRPPHWRAYRAPGEFVEAARTAPAAALEAFALSSELMARDLAEVGIDVDCVPMLDIRQPDSNPQVIGDRALGDDADTVIRFAEVMIDAVERAGVCGVIKHLPGHGRAAEDSHDALPNISADQATLSAVDFAPFRHFAPRVPYGMTGHLLYTGIDPDRVSTLSETVVGEVIRRDIGFDGLLMTDDISMGALGGTIGERARGSTAAGCDVVLHCNGDMDEMRELAATVGEMDAPAVRRMGRADACREGLSQARSSGDTAADGRRLDALLGDLFAC
jgi:beta-N-acetylhexosaminidase